MTTKEGSPIAYAIAIAFATLEYVDRFADIMSGWLAIYIDVATAISVTTAAVFGILRIVDKVRENKKRKG